MMAYGNMEEWELLKIKKPDGEVVPAIEVPFELVLKGITLPDGRGISIIGYIDAAMRNLVTDLHRTLDIKTNRSFLRDASPKYQFDNQQTRSEEHTSELQSLMRISYAVFCLKKKKKTQ